LFHLPRSRWNALKDKVINVQIEDNDLEDTFKAIGDVVRSRIVNIPINDNEMHERIGSVSSLPRSIFDSGIIPVKLKRKLTFKSSLMSSFIDPNKMVQTLNYLKERGHAGYENVNINISNLQIQDTDNSQMQSQDEIDDDVTSTIEDVNQPTMFYENNPEIRVRTHLNNDDNHNELCVAPGEGKVPTNLMCDPHWDVNAFPLLFPSGKFRLNHERAIKLSPQKYFGQRLLNQNSKFCNYPPWLFSALYYIERQQLEQHININYRRGAFINQKILQIEDGFNVFDKISGTPR
jgi:hypothetical protein